MHKQIGLIGAVIILLLLLVVPVDVDSLSRLAKCIVDLLHFPLGALMMLLGYLLLPAKVSRAMRLMLALVFVVVSLLCVEFIQGYTGREFSWIDMGYACLGALVSGYVIIGITYNGKGVCVVAFCSICLFVLVALFPVYRVLLDQHRIRASYPLLAGFESTFELSRWHADSCSLLQSEVYSTEGYYAGKIVIDDEFEEYPGVFMDSLLTDWSKSYAVAFDAYWEPITPAKIWIRLDDLEQMPEYSQRVQVMVVLTQGMNHIQIKRNEYEKTPSGRKMDLSRIARFGLFFEKAESGDTLYIDNLRLIEKDEQ